MHSYIAINELKSDIIDQQSQQITKTRISIQLPPSSTRIQFSVCVSSYVS